MRELLQDEHRTRVPLRLDRARSRRHVTVMLEGSARVVIGDEVVDVRAGDAFIVREGEVFASRGADSDALEIEWDPGTFGDTGRLAPPSRVRLSHRSRASMHALANATREAGSGEALVAPLENALTALASEGVPVDPTSARLVPPSTHEDQLFMHELDHVIVRLAQAPMLIDLETQLRVSRRTLTRRIASLNASHGIIGRSVEQWRHGRDLYRLVTASIFLSHREATPKVVAAHVGYGSVEALDHAFSRAGLPSPAAFTSTTRAYAA
ncbi:MAG: hypothetical protein ABI183_18675 [Polyangiaceae bacterium]